MIDIVISTMGRLDRLELHNFKSYGGDVLVGPFKGFTAVIGTNGSGKSNLMDAISFVLGVRTAQLRGNQLRDLVYRNLEDPQDDPSKRRAYVKLVYRQSEDPISEVEFMRTVTVNGASEYRVRGRVLSLEAYNAELASIGVLVKARNFLVFQNEVQSIASRSPIQLTALFEEVSQSSEFKEKYEQARTDKDAAEETVTQFWRKRKGMAAEKRQYREQKEEAERYERLQQQLADTKTEQALFELFHVDEDINLRKAEVATLTEKLEENEREFATKESALKSEKNRVQKLENDKVKLDRKKKRFAEEIEKLHPLKVKYETEKASLIRRIKGDERSLEKMREEHAKEVETVKSLEAELESVREAIRLTEDEIKAAEVSSVSAQSMAEYRSLKDQVETRTSMLQQEFDTARRNLKGLDSQRVALERRGEDLQNRVTTASRKASDYRARAEELQIQLNRTSEEAEQLKHERAQLAEVGQERENVRKTLERTINDVTQALRDAKADMTQSSREENFNRALERMQNLFPGVHGRLSDLCQPTQARYREAIAVIFGKMMDAIVVDNSNTGKQCIDYLKDQRVGIGTFIPLAEIRARPIDESLRRLGGTSRLAVDVIKHRDFVAKAVLYAAGNAVVCDTLDEARYIRYECGQKIKICSLDGTLINKAGFMTGGTTRGEMDRARKWDRGEVESLKRKRQTAVEELEKLGTSDADRRTASDVLERIETIDREILLMENDRRDFISRSRSADIDREQATKELEQLTPQLRTAKGSYEAAKEKVQTIEASLHGLENELFGDFIKQHNFESVQQFEGLFVGKAEKIREKKLELETKESKIITSLKFLRSQHGSTPMSKLEKRIEARKSRLTELEKELENVGSKRSELESRAAAVDKDIEEVTKQKQEASDAIAEQRQEFRRESENVGEVRKSLEDQRGRLEQLLSVRKRLLTTAKVLQVKLPVLEGQNGGNSGSADREGRDSNQEAADARESDGDIVMQPSTEGEEDGDEGNTNSVMVNVNVVLDYSVLSRRHRAATSVERQKEILESYSDDMKSIEQKLDGLAPNMKATEHMTDVVEKLNEIDREAEQAREHARQAVSTFEEIKQKRQNRFNECFNHVAGKINDVYKELTKSTAYPMGGTAYLSLEQQDEPYLAGVKFNTMPPTKRFRDMEQLSGGERTVAALALLFAIHDYRPSPFFVLDEVDAALDNLNVGRVSRYIQSRAPELQTIVISLKDTFFERADALIGIYRDMSAKASRLLTMDLTQFPEENSQTQSN